MSLTGEDNNNNTTNTLLEKTTLDPNGGGSKPKPGNPNPRITYRECQKNHAANIGGNVTDGCGEFMPSGADGTLDALKCAACSCHRNFHRKDHLAPPPPRGGASTWGTAAHPVQMAFVGGGGTDSSSEEMNFNAFGAAATAVAQAQFGAKKRFRTKFTAEQKEKMMAFAVKIGWRIPREDDSELQRFCAEVGVKRQVFKVWMHNNKITSSDSKSAPPEF